MITQNSENFQTKKRIKIVLLGDRSVGKSSIINRFITNHFQQNLQPTVGVDFMGKNIKYKECNYRVQLWDTAGQEKYRSLVKGYLKGADACILVYDCSSISSYANIPQWLNLFQSVGCPNSYKIIVANKCDIQFNSQNLQQSKKAIKQQYEQIRTIPQYLTSAKLGINIQQIFQQIMENVTMKRNKYQQQHGFNHIFIGIGQYTKSTAYGCCK